MLRCRREHAGLDSSGMTESLPRGSTMSINTETLNAVTRAPPRRPGETFVLFRGQSNLNASEELACEEQGAVAALQAGPAVPFAGERCPAHCRRSPADGCRALPAPTCAGAMGRWRQSH